MAGDTAFGPGEAVKTSGVYTVVHEDGKDSFDVLCLEGEQFPASRRGRPHFELKFAAPHARRHEHLQHEADQASGPDAA